jgi:hypothetical protein
MTCVPCVSALLLSSERVILVMNEAFVIEKRGVFPQLNATYMFVYQVLLCSCVFYLKSSWRISYITTYYLQIGLGSLLEAPIDDDQSRTM